MRRNIVKVFCGVAASFFFSVAANATLLDSKTINYEYLFPSTDMANNWYGAGSYEVGAGVEAAVGDTFSTDFSDTNILMDFSSSGQWCGCDFETFNGVHFYDALDTIDDFTSVSLNALTNMVGLTQANISFDANNIWIDWQDLYFDANTLVSIDLQNATVDVPEPSSLLMMMSGLFALVFFRRRS